MNRILQPRLLPLLRVQRHQFLFSTKSFSLSAIKMSTDSTRPLKKRSVVSSFIFNLHKTPDHKPQVALFRRSDKVSTYQHHLAPISGSIEISDPNPLSAAWREISEETTLTPSDLRLLRQGKPYTFSDPSIRREWTIHPFAFALRDPSSANKIQIDWEHESWGWYDPLTVTDDPSFGGVPRLVESLRRVWFEMDLGAEAAAILSGGLDSLANDTTSGARQMAGHALITLRDVVSVLPVDDPEKWWRNVRSAAWHLSKNGRESMGAAIAAACLNALSEIESTSLESPDIRSATLSLLDEVIQTRDATTASIASSLTNYLTTTFPPPAKLTILTLSQSSTITTSLLHFLSTSPSQQIEIRILESRPLFEGVSLAKSLRSSQSHHQPKPKPKIKIYTDAASALASTDINILLLGADKISPTGSASNKTGSLPAVLAARFVTHNRAKIAVVTDTDKVGMPNELESNHVLEEQPGDMVSRAWSQSTIETESMEGVEISNVFFEWVPAELIDVYITERGEQTAADMAARSAELGREEQRIFGSL
ncbi:nagb/rpia/CoA transferase-like protein [Echria macrotheca]|uniref:Nagb/rpia/CoA transferase-like protein n=1 Tax=Echria macrotheca TaxID=438768 RepID=A0AAJ0FAD4_9PEZI|nr:nagb/rpia/CoA transferase-like protein [Echria macrotheca]